MKTVLRIVPKLLIVIVIVILTACTKNPTATPGAEPAATANPVQSYADPATEITLQGLSENNYEKYTQFFSQATRAAVTKEVFEKSSTQIQAQLGNYVSKTFLSTENKDNYVIVHYQAKYTKGPIKIRMVFDTNQQIAGQWFE
jgi:type IV pilus biogenesis protein CpaD/CtpE